MLSIQNAALHSSAFKYSLPNLL